MYVLTLLLFFSFSFAEVVAKVNGVEITKEELDRKFKTYWEEILHFSPGKPKEEDRIRFLMEYIKGIILEDVAGDMGIEVSEEEVQRRLRIWGKRRPSELVRELVRREIIAEKLENRLTEDLRVSDEEVKAYYMLNKREFSYPNQIKLLRVVAYDKKKAYKVFKLLKGGNNVDPEEGIIVGKERWYSLQALPKVVKRKLYPYKVGKVSKPIKIEGGYLILKITSKRKAGYLPLSEVKDRVRDKILKLKKKEVLREWFRDILKGYDLELYLR